MNPAQAAQSPTGSNQTFGTPSQGQLAGAAGNVFQHGANVANPLAFSNPQGAYEGERNQAFQNLLGGAYKQQLAPMFASSMFGAAKPTENFYNQMMTQGSPYFSQLMNLGSPYYAQHQTASFQNALNDYNNAYAQAANQLRGQGLGYGPTGANVAMLGGMGQGFAQDAASQYLQNLFQNENLQFQAAQANTGLQMQGAGGMAGLANLFQPGPLLGATPVASLGVNPTMAQNFAGITSGIGSLFGGAGQGMQGYAKLTGGSN